MDAPTPVTPALAPSTWYFRSTGAVLGGFLGLGTMGAIYLISAIPAVESIVHIRALLDPEGFLAMGGALPPWAVAPIAAGLAGLICTPRVMTGRRWAGVAMGFGTYALGVLIAPLAVFAPPWAVSDPTFGADPGIANAVADMLIGLPAVAAVASIVLAPLLFVCAAAGAVWAFGLRTILVGGGATVGTQERPTIDGKVLLGIGILLGVGWLAIALPMLTIFGDPGFVD